MDHNSLAEVQVKRIVDDATVYIQTQRNHFLKKSLPLSSEEKMGLKNFFSDSILSLAKFYKIENEIVDNPVFLSQLNDYGYMFPDVNSFDATTFRDVIIWRKELTARTKFHELVHVVQYQKLGGIGTFANKYMRGLFNSGGYRSIPIEEHAYQLDGRYTENPDRFFSVEAEVDDWIAKGMY